MTKKQYRTPKVSVGTVKKSIAAMASRWFLRNVSHRFTGSGFLGARRIHRETLLSERSKPSLSSSPRMRGAPQVGFSATIRKIKARTSLLTRFRPPTWLILETYVQYKRNPARCQFTTVLGVTKTRGCLHPDQHILNATQNSCAGQSIDGEVVARAEPAIADGEPGFRGRGPPGDWVFSAKILAMIVSLRHFLGWLVSSFDYPSFPKHDGSRHSLHQNLR
jgi:hypothetical protein